jgi:GNAT superfamily N-acetyltransferase
LSDVALVPPGERHRAIATMLLAFVSDPVVRWALPDPDAYARTWPAFCEPYAGAAFEHQSAYALDGYAAVALWLPPGVHSDDAAMAQLMYEAAEEPVLRDLDGFFSQMGDAHPTFDHWYLPLVGVDPVAQGRGLGTTLLRHALARCDADGLPAYLEATSPRSRDLYLRHGFEEIAVVQHRSSPPMWPMLRQPVARL